MRGADNIIVLDHNGTVSQQGTFDSLSSERGPLKDLTVNFSDEKIQSASGSGETVEDHLAKRAPLVTKIDESKDDLLRQTGDLTLYKYYAKSVGWKDGVVIVALSFGSQFCAYFSRKLHH